MRNCMKCEHKKSSFNINNMYLCDITCEFVYPKISPWICGNYKEKHVICNDNVCCKKCNNKCSNNCCQEVKEENNNEM